MLVGPFIQRDWLGLLRPLLEKWEVEKLSNLLILIRCAKLPEQKIMLWPNITPRFRSTMVLSAMNHQSRNFKKVCLICRLRFKATNVSIMVLKNVFRMNAL